MLKRLSSSRIARAGAWSLAIRIANTGLVFLSTVLLARLLGASGFGIYSYVWAWATLLSVPSQFGLPALVVRETARGMAGDEFRLVRGTWVWATRFTTLTSLGIAGTAGTIAWLLGTSNSDGTLQTFAWALALIPLVALGSLRGAALRGMHLVIAGQLPEYLIRPGLFVAMLATAIILGVPGSSPQEAMAMHVLAAALAFCAAAWMLWRAAPRAVRVAAPLFRQRAWILSTLPLALTSQMQVINRQGAIVLLGFFVSDADIGMYRIAAQVSLLAAFGLQAANVVLAPRFARLYARRDVAALQRSATVSARAILAFNIAVTVGFTILGKSLLGWAFGSEYTAAYVPMVILLVGQLVNSAAGSVAVLLNMTGHERETARGVVVAALSNVGLNLGLIPILGIAGAALGTAISLMTWNLLLLRAVRRRLRINSSALPWF